MINKFNLNFVTRSFHYILTLSLLLIGQIASSTVLDDIKADMGNNEAALYNAPVGPGWTQKAFIGMGSAPRGDATPTWWLPSNLNYKSSASWNALVPWFVIYPAVGNTAKNVRVKVYGITLYMLDKTTKKWIKVDTGLGKPTWASNYDFNLVTWKATANTRTEADGNISYKLSSESYPIHGGSYKIDFSKYINPTNISAVFVTLKTQLILDNPLGVNDLASAKILLNVGTDYYPTVNSTVADFTPMGYVPALGGSRFGLVKTVARSHYLATIDPPGSTNPDTVFIKNGGSVAISVTEFSSNMPPILPADTTAPSTPTSIVLSISKTSTSVSATLSWKASTDNVGVVGYNIYRNNVKIGSTTSLSYKDTMYSLPTGALYSYTIRAFDSAGNLSSPSGAVLMVY